MIMKHFHILCVFVLVFIDVSFQLISPHGGYLTIDEGSDFFLECVGDQARWIVPKRIGFDSARLTTFSIQQNRKAILVVQGMDQSFVSPYLCQTNQSISTAILQLRKRQRVFHKQIRFMATNNNHTIQYGSDVRLNCYAQYYSEKAMDSPYIPKVLWFFERHQIMERNEKFLLGTDSLVIRNFTENDQGVYYCRAFITLKTHFLTRTYPIFVQLQDPNRFSGEMEMSSSRSCPNFTEAMTSIRSISYCDVDGKISNFTCPENQIWNHDFSQCTMQRDVSPFLEIVPNVSEIYVELGRTYTFLCRSKDHRYEPEWMYDGRRVVERNSSSIESITSYRLNNNHTVYLRLSAAMPGTFICRSRPAFPLENNNDDKQEVTISITLKAQMIAEQNGISFQSSTLAEYNLRRNSTWFIACRPEYFDFQTTINKAFIPQASLYRVQDSTEYTLSEINDGLLIDRIDFDRSGMYICIGRLPLKNQLISAMYPVMVFVSDG